MAKKVLFRVVFVLLALMCTAAQCHVDDITVDMVVEYTGERAEDSPVCELTWVSTDLQVRLAHFHACKPEAGEEEKFAKKYLADIQECAFICTNGFVEGSSSRAACIEVCRGPYEGPIDYE